jgi:formate hydrogenlyase subunit 3/multisubunit Na+/H+ antiporter MnhD subunit
MEIFLLGLLVIFTGGVFALLAGRSARLSTLLGVGSAVVGSVIGLVPTIRVLLSGHILSMNHSWQVPLGSFSLQIDPVAAVFLLPIFILSAVAAVYGGQYLQAYRDRKNLGVSWFFYNLLVVGMAMVIAAHNGVLFLIAWEVMSIASFFLVTFEDEREEVRRAGWIYLVATHIGTAFLMVFFILLAMQSGTFDFDASAKFAPAMANVLFVLAVIGFGTKAGFIPMHIWLPLAHPVAPSHVSAVMSGVMIKTGIYGLIRAILLLGGVERWWCWALIGIGVVCGVLGVLFALAQRDLKRVLAYSSVENIGIITLGLGVGFLGVQMKSPAIAVLGLAGGLFHVINHAMFKGLLFLSAGSVLHGCGTLELDRLGGLYKKMRWTGLAFLIGTVAICGLPPLNGFAGELLIYLSAIKGGMSAGHSNLGVMLAVVGGLALIGGLAAACFARAFGIVFLGEPRSEMVGHAHEAGWAMRLSMLTLAGACVVLGIFSPAVVRAGSQVLTQMTGLTADAVGVEIVQASDILRSVVRGAVLLAGLVLILAVFRRALLRRRGTQVKEGPTWGCGYVQPTARIQYTASSFAQPLTTLFRSFLRGRRNESLPTENFPADGHFDTDTPDIFERHIFQPAMANTRTLFARLHWMQHGRLQIYILYIALTLWILLLWKLR